MSSQDPLGDAFRLLLGFVQKLHTGEERQLLEVAAGAAAFLSFTGQLHRFEDFRRSPAVFAETAPEFDKVIRLIERMKGAVASEEMGESLLTAVHAVAYVGASDQREGLEDYLDYWRNSTLPPVAAVFKTHEEAEAWARAQLAPPYRARVLIADEYFHVVGRPPSGSFRFVRKAEVVDFIEKHSRDGLPPVEASFETREEAEAWFANIPEPRRNIFIEIGGMHHVAAYWKNVNHRAIYSFKLAEDVAQEMRAMEEAFTQNKTDESESS